MGTDTHLRALLGSGMLSWGLETCIPPGAHPSHVPALAAQLVPCPAQGSIAQVSASAGHPILQTGVPGSLEHPHHTPHTSPGSSLAPCKGQDCSQAARGPEGQRHCCRLGVLPSQMAVGDVFATPSTPQDGLGASTWLQTTIHQEGKGPSPNRSWRSHGCSQGAQKGLKTQHLHCPRGRTENMKQGPPSRRCHVLRESQKQNC